MSDSVDRVFSHALNTVNKIRTGAEKPPPATRLKLYGLYKQSMEGNVDGIMIRPTGKDEESQRSREKWDAWKSCSGLSRTEAKRRYITTLIETMRKYASASPDSRELVEELEFVWDQVKSNVHSSNSSSPVHNTSGLGISSPTATSPPQALSAPVFSFLNKNFRRVGAILPPPASKRTSQELRVMTQSPLSQSAIDDSDSEDGQPEHFVDAPDSQIAAAGPSNPHPTFSDDNKSTTSNPLLHSQDVQVDDSKDAKKAVTKKPQSDNRWRKKIESTLIRLTAEVAALREQLEARSWAKAKTRRGRFEQIFWSVFSFLAKMIAVDLVLLVFILMWMRRKKDGRLEGAIRVLLGDAVASVSKVGTGVQRQAIQAQKGVQRGVRVVGKMALGAKKPSGGGSS